MCFSSPKTPPVVTVDPTVEADKTANEAAAVANADSAARARTRRKSALSTGAGAAQASALSYGKTTLGG